MHTPPKTQARDTHRETGCPWQDLLLGSALLVMDAVMAGTILYLLVSGLIRTG